MINVQEIFNWSIDQMVCLLSGYANAKRKDRSLQKFLKQFKIRKEFSFIQFIYSFTSF